MLQDRGAPSSVEVWGGCLGHESVGSRQSARGRTPHQQREEDHRSSEKEQKLTDETKREIASTYIELHSAVLCREHGASSVDRAIVRCFGTGRSLHKFSDLGVKNFNKKSLDCCNRSINNNVHGRGATEEVHEIQTIKEVNSIAPDGESSSCSKERCLRA